MSLFIVSVQKNFVKQSTSLILNSNKLSSTINIVQNKLIVKSKDLDYIFKVLERNIIPFTVKQIN